MHIAFLTPEYPHPKAKHAGGLGTSVKNLAMALVEKGIRVSVFIYGQPVQEVFEEEGIRFHLIDDKKYLYGKWFFYRKHIQNYLQRIIKEEAIDLLEAPDWTGITAFMRFKIPLVIRFHGSDTYFCHIEKRKQKWKNHWFESLAVKNAQGYIAPTSFAGKISSELFGIPIEKVQTIHYGLNLDQFQNENPLQFEKGLLLYIGTIIRKKGVFELPEIFKKVHDKFPEAKLVLIGGDSKDVQTGSISTWQLLKEQFGEGLLNYVTYLGKVPYSEVQTAIKNANVCLFPTYAETLGMVTIESMAMQKAVVNSNIGWAQELMEDGKSGFLIHPSDHDAYSDRILQLINDSQLAISIGIEARKYVLDKFDILKQASLNIDFYEKMIH
ncbi:glycosyltransferase family 4 protein [Flavobacterium gelidilacus]|uniref:glycosyltransferase family 4 protein n=1 Tax=Flavobacterium gelidilacus TaxID=206041 RepID=UPI000424C7D2|nr:glycosyltransferase family 4 protein [Flavobacterium gelidilacus]